VKLGGEPLVGGIVRLWHLEWQPEEDVDDAWIELGARALA
jgi:hypothetical protein